MTIPRSGWAVLFAVGMAAGCTQMKDQTPVRDWVPAAPLPPGYATDATYSPRLFLREQPLTPGGPGEARPMTQEEKAGLQQQPRVMEVDPSARPAPEPAPGAAASAAS